MEKFSKSLKSVARFLRTGAGRATAIAVVGGGLYFAANLWGDAGARDANAPAYLVAERDLPEGHPLGVKDMDIFAGDPRRETVPQDAYSDQKLHWVLGRRLLRPLKAGEWIREGELDGRRAKGLSRRVPSGHRAYSLQVDSRLPVAPGDRVDLVFRSENPGDVPVTLLEGVLVLQADLETGGMIVAVRPGELPLMEKAQQSGKLTVALRNDSEEMTQGRGNASLGRRQPKARVQLWTEGE